MVSFEFFPPKTPEGMAKLRDARDRLAGLNPAFFSVTFGAGGSTQDRTLDTVLDIQQAGYAAAPHLSCITSTQEQIGDMLHSYQQHGIRRIVALRGDLPSGDVSLGQFRYGSELVAFIRKQSADAFHIEVAAYPEFHPESRSPTRDLQHFRQKVQAGANSAITQYFYNVDAYFRFIEQCQSLAIEIPIVPGVMPIYNITQLARFSSVCGAEIPRWLRLRLEEYADDLPSLRQLGCEVVTELCDKLISGGAPGIHFYTLNQAQLILEITRNLRWPVQTTDQQPNQE